MGVKDFFFLVFKSDLKPTEPELGHFYLYKL